MRPLVAITAIVAVVAVVSVLVLWGSGSVGEENRAGAAIAIQQDPFSTALDESIAYWERIHDSLDAYETGHRCPESRSLLYGQPLQYQKVRHIGQGLEALAKAYPYLSRSQQERVRPVMDGFAEWLLARVDTAQRENGGVESDYAACYIKGGETLTSWNLLKGLEAHWEISGDRDERDAILAVSGAFMEYVDGTRSGSWSVRTPANANNRATHLDVLYIRHLVDPAAVTAEDIVRRKIDYDYLEKTKVWKTSQFKCGVPLGFGSWMHTDPPADPCIADGEFSSQFVSSYHQLVGYHSIIVGGLTSYYKLLHERDLCWEPAFTYRNGERSICDQMRWTLVSAISWVHSISRDDGTILQAWPSFPAEEDTQGTINGLAAQFEALSVVDDGTYNHFPYYPDFPERSSRTMTRDMVLDRALQGVKTTTALEQFRHKVILYAPYYFAWADLQAQAATK